MSHLYKMRLKKSSSTEFNGNWLDSWEYIEERREFFFLEFSVHTPLQQWALKWRKPDSNSQKRLKIRDLKTCTRQNSLDSQALLRRTPGFFFRIFRPYPAPAVGLRVEKTRVYLLKQLKTCFGCHFQNGPMTKSDPPSHSVIIYIY